ncbi:glycosyltransferase family 4 protein [Methanobrevibacter curvatus]|uniref:Putative teichuronic acid biosynthesis glycosyltransferase TuaC n=1 Tax=Methanobrevibacter curvatus TaxID=49547 RepID=A0A166CU14_9EURY|nr:glycosyltransferase family 4 protein [Methanobrevibacter curvatus]KZX14865.1 putative teichuronic acid biosynthesis glycosyltransferase TuaC [Methanobrevibacter curvatus]
MKIAIVGQYPPHIGGISNHTNKLSQKLVENGDEVFVITYYHKDIKKQHHNKQQHNENIHVMVPYGINIPGLRALFFIIFGTIKLIKIVKKYDIDIIHGHYLFPAGLIAVLGGIFTKKKVYVTSHGSDILILYKNNKIIRPLIKFILNRADVVLVVSKALKDEIIKINLKDIESKTKIHLNSVDIDKFKELGYDSESTIGSKNISEKRNISNIGNDVSNIKKEMNIINNFPTIIFVGNLVNAKNLFTLLNAKKLMKNESNLLIVGDGLLSNELKKTVAKNKIKNVIFTGIRKDVEKIIPYSDMLILPSFSESFGLVLLEGLACGKPVIGSNIGGIREIITDDVGILINPNNPQEMANAMDLIIEDQTLRDKFKKNARKRALEFSDFTIPYENIEEDIP